MSRHLTWVRPKPKRASSFAGRWHDHVLHQSMGWLRGMVHMIEEHARHNLHTDLVGGPFDGRVRSAAPFQPDRPVAESTMPARSNSASTRIRSRSRSGPAVSFLRSCWTSNISQACINSWSYATRFAS